MKQAEDQPNLRWKLIFNIMFKPWKWAGLWFIILAVLGGLAPLLQFWTIRQLVNQLSVQLQTQRPTDTIWLQVWQHMPYLVLLIGAWIMVILLTMNIFQPYLATIHTEHIRHYWNKRLLASASQTRLEYFEQSSYYNLLQRAQKALNNPQLVTQHSQFQRMITRLAASIALIGVFIQLSWAIACLLVVSGIAVTYWRIKRNRTLIRIRKQHTPEQRQQEYWQKLLTEKSAATEIRMFNLGPTFVQRWRSLYQKQHLHYAQLRRSNFRQEVPITLAHMAMYSGLGVYIVYAAQHSQLSPGILLASLVALQQYIDLLQNFTRLDSLQQVVSELNYVADWLDHDLNDTGFHAVPHGVPTIEFENVSFSYPNSVQPILNQINLVIKPGEQIALVGENGAGKTTLVKLLLGLYQPNSGRIMINGIDLVTIDKQQWRACIAAVFQHAARFKLTVRENIMFGNLQHQDNHTKLLAAAKYSNLLPDIEALSQGFDTQLGKEWQTGTDLSGGQWQKIALARAFFKDAPFIVLDEPSASLDAYAEHVLYQNFLKLGHQKTVLLISHRLGAARLAQRIIVLKHGQIIEDGSHAELINQAGQYAHMYSLQAAWYDKETTHVDMD